MLNYKKNTQQNFKLNYFGNNIVVDPKYTY